MKAIAETMNRVESGEIPAGRVFEVVPDGKGGFQRVELDAKAVQAKFRARHEQRSQAAAARESLGMSQAQFAELLGISRRTLEGWEQGRRSPAKAAQVLIAIAQSNPKAVLEVAGMAK